MICKIHEYNLMTYLPNQMIHILCHMSILQTPNTRFRNLIKLCPILVFLNFWLASIASN